MATKKKNYEEMLNDPLAAKKEEAESITQNPQKNTLMSDTTKFTPKAETKSSQPKIIRDETTGMKTGITLPDGRTMVGISPKEVDFLERKYYGTGEPLSNKFESQNQSMQPVQSEKTPETLVSNEVTPQDIQQVGQLNQEINPQTLLNTDEGIRKLYSDTLNNAMAREGNKGVVITDTLYNLIPGGQYKKALINAITTNPDRKQYLSGYSNEDNMESVIKNLELTDKDIENAKTLASIPGYSKQAMETYRIAQAKKQLFYTQLKIISTKDQRAYTSKAKDQMVEIESYWQSGKINDDLEMQSRLNRANGVVQNG